MSGDAATIPSRSAAPATADYVLCGWRVRSAIPLPEAMPWPGDDRPPDVTIRLGSAPPLLDPVWTGGPVQMGRYGVCRLEFDGIGRFLVVEGREVICEPCSHLNTPEVRAWLLGPVLGALSHQRGLFPLHAACIRIGERAVALSGRTGAGKSTLAAALVRRGHGLIADDICVIEPAEPKGPRVLPSFPRLKLSPDVLRALDVSANGMARTSVGKRRYFFCPPKSFDPSPVGLRGIYFLDGSTVLDQQDIRSESGASAVTILSREIYRRQIGFHLGRKVALLADALRIAAAVPVFCLPVRAELSQLDAIAARIEAHFSLLGRGRRETA